jgi:endo-1,4-beta-xylanase
MGHHETTFSGADVQQILENHITQVITHYKNKYPGVVIAWDVVNEPFSDQTDANRNLLPRKTVFNTIGSDPLDYIAVAFRAARAADPNAILCLNDYTNQGGLAAPNDKRTEQEFQLVSSLKAAGVPIDCIGMEMHLGLGWQFPRYQGVLDTMKRYAGIDVQVQVREFDFGMKTASKTDLNKQATFYHDMLQACIASANCTQFTTWGFTDKYSWIPSFFSGYGFALPFDRTLRPKPAYSALQNALLEQ